MTYLLRNLRIPGTMASARLAFVSLALLAGALAVQPARAASGIETAAREAILVDFDTGAVLLEKNSDKPMPPSSMSKLMTAVMVFDRLKAGTLKLDDTLHVSEKAWRMGGSKMFVHVNDRVKIEDLLRGVIIQSGNDACIVLAEGLAGSEEAFAAEMNARAKEIGLTGSTLRNATGWPDPDHLMTARDLATLARHIITAYPEYYHFYSEKEFTYAGIRQGNRNPLLYRNNGTDGLKTGHTEAAGYGLTASATRGDRRLILVVNGLKSMQERADETDRLLDWGFREFGNYRLFKKGEAVAEADVWLGDAKVVPLLAGQDALITLPRKARPHMKVVAKFDGPIPAPVAKGTAVGKLVVTAPDMTPVELPLVAGADVEKLGFLGRISAAARYLIWGSAG